MEPEDLLKIQITYRNYFCPATPRRFTAGQQAYIGVGLGDINQTELMRGHSLILISRMYLSGHNDTIVARSIPREIFHRVDEKR